MSTNKSVPVNNTNNKKLVNPKDKNLKIDPVVEEIKLPPKDTKSKFVIISI